MFKSNLKKPLIKSAQFPVYYDNTPKSTAGCVYNITYKINVTHEKKKY